MEYDKLTDDEVKKIESIERRLLKITNEVEKMGLCFYLSPQSINIMKGSSHDETNQAKPLYDNIRHSFFVKGWDGGDWQ